jgi:neurotransmitter:Na+ symporter, NSS family
MSDNTSTLQPKKREQWGGRLGFVLATAGSAVGLGNIMKFPYMTGKNGGAAFVFVYIIVNFVIGAAMLLCDFLIGRNGRANAVESYRKICKKYSWMGYLGMFGAVLALAYYAVFGGWMLYYIFTSFTSLATIDPSGVGDFFGTFISNPWKPIIFQIIFLLLTMWIVMGGIKKGIEKANKVMMPALIVILLILIVRVLTLPGAGEGIKFYLKPDFSLITPAVFAAAVGQVFFSLNVGTTGMVVYGSYLSETENVPKSTAMVVMTDFSVAFLAGFIVIPSAFAFGIEPSSGVSLLFITMPSLFRQMPLGSVFCFLFFILLLFASLTSSISILEICVPYLTETSHEKISRKKASVLVTIICFLLGIPVSLGFGAWSNVTIAGMGFFELYDNFICIIAYPLIAMCTAIMVGWVWKKDNALDAVSNHHALKNDKLYNVWFFIVKYIAPEVLFVVVLIGLGIIK